MAEVSGVALPPERQGCHDGAVDRAQELTETLRALGQVCMTWWVSGTVLCATILGLSWAHRDEVRRAGRLATHGLFGLVTVFFASICTFGFAMVFLAGQLGEALVQACGSAPTGAGGCSPSDAHLLKSTVVWGVSIGTTSFVLFAIAWVAAWIITIREDNQVNPGAAEATTI